jgi:Fic family protein
MSSQIRLERSEYYEILSRTQQGGPDATLDVTPWMAWFVACLGRAIDGAQAMLGSVMNKARFWENVQGISLSERHNVMLNRLLDGFEGKLTTSKYAKLAKCSEDTALRDITYLVERGILLRGSERGRSTGYSLAQS